MEETTHAICQRIRGNKGMPYKTKRLLGHPTDQELRKIYQARHALNRQPVQNPIHRNSLNHDYRIPLCVYVRVCVRAQVCNRKSHYSLS